MRRPIITLTTDFGLSDHYAGTMKGVILGICPQAEIVDLSHQVGAYEVMEGAFLVAQAYRYFPRGTVHVVVIDPGVGTARRPILAEAAGQRFVAPDNGVLSMMYAREKPKVRWITAERYFLKPVSQTFHGRDIFSPVGAHVARGEDWTQAGPELPVKDLVRLNIEAARLDDRGLSGEVIATDGPFGNLVTNIYGSEFLKLGYERGQKVRFTIGQTEMTIPFVRTFNDVPLKKPLMYIDSRGHLGLAVNQGSFAATYKIKPPISIFVPRVKD